jgi:hypothetical protein
VCIGVSAGCIGSLSGTFATYGFPSNNVVANLPGGQTITVAFVPEPSTMTGGGCALGAIVF